MRRNEPYLDVTRAIWEERLRCFEAQARLAQEAAAALRDFGPAGKARAKAFEAKAETIFWHISELREELGLE